MNTVGSIWSQLPFSKRGLPRASWNGPVGLSPTATPIAMPFDNLEWAQIYQKKWPSRSMHWLAQARSSAQEKLSKARGDPWSVQFTMSRVE